MSSLSFTPRAHCHPPSLMQCKCVPGYICPSIHPSTHPSHPILSRPHAICTLHFHVDPSPLSLVPPLLHVHALRDADWHSLPQYWLCDRTACIKEPRGVHWINIICSSSAYQSVLFHPLFATPLLSRSLADITRHSGSRGTAANLPTLLPPRPSLTPRPPDTKPCSHPTTGLEHLAVFTQGCRAQQPLP